MNPTPLRRSIAAIGTALACLALMANPAAATIHTSDITGGELALIKPSMTPEVIDLGPGTGPCPAGAWTLDVDTASSTLSVTAIDQRVITSLSSPDYLVVFTRYPLGNSPGPVSSATTPHTFSSLRVAVAMSIYGSTRYNTSSCSVSVDGTTGLPFTPTCTLLVLLNVSGTLTSLSPSTQLSATFSSLGTVAMLPGCSGPTFLVGSTAAATTPFTAHLT